MRLLSDRAARAVFAASIIAALGACGGETRPDPVTLEELIADCTARWGYAPEKARNLGPNQLGHQERQWRACMYDLVEQRMVPNTQFPELYRALIEEDKSLTDQVAAGQITRAQRTALVTGRIDAIQAKEQKARAADEERTRQFMEQEMQRMQEMQRYEQLLRRSFTPVPGSIGR